MGSVRPAASLTGFTFRIGLGWLAVGFVHLLFLTRVFGREPPEMYAGEDDDLGGAGPPSGGATGAFRPARADGEWARWR